MKRRHVMQGAAAALLATTATAWGQPGKAGGRGIVVAQIVDSSPAQQDLARDFLIGSRAPLFVGGTPELVQFTQGLERQPRQRYLVTLADVNLQTLMQLGGTRSTVVIATQPVPMVTAGLPVVREYRSTLARLFDEAPAPLSLAGYIAARYTFAVLSGIDGAVSRLSALAAFQRRDSMDLGGFRVSFGPQRRSSIFVTQTMLTVEGRVVG